MPKVRAEFDLPDYAADPADETGVTLEAYEDITNGLMAAGAENIKVSTA